MGAIGDATVTRSCKDFFKVTLAELLPKTRLLQSCSWLLCESCWSQGLNTPLKAADASALIFQGKPCNPLHQVLELAVTKPKLKIQPSSICMLIHAASTHNSNFLWQHNMTMQYQKKMAHRLIWTMHKYNLWRRMRIRWKTKMEL